MQFAILDANGRLSLKSVALGVGSLKIAVALRVRELHFFQILFVFKKPLYLKIAAAFLNRVAIRIVNLQGKKK